MFPLGCTGTNGYYWRKQIFFHFNIYQIQSLGIEYCLAFDWVSLICIGLGLVLLVVGLYHVKLWIPAAEN